MDEYRGLIILTNWSLSDIKDLGVRERRYWVKWYTARAERAKNAQQ